MAVHLLVEPMDRKAICGTVASGYGTTLSEESVTCGACLAVVRQWYAEAEAEFNAMAEMETEAEAMAMGFGLRVWE